MMLGAKQSIYRKIFVGNFLIRSKSSESGCPAPKDEARRIAANIAKLPCQVRETERNQCAAQHH
jgi:hypothetical protein